MGKLITICAFIICIGALSQADDDKKNHEGPCAKDRETLCANVEPGEGKIAKCLMENKDKLSAECREHKEKMQEKRKKHMKEIKEACHEDADKFCGDVEPGKGRIIKCMKDHKEELSASCKQEIESKKEKRKHGRKASP